MYKAIILCTQRKFKRQLNISFFSKFIIQTNANTIYGQVATLFLCQIFDRAHLIYRNKIVPIRVRNLIFFVAEILRIFSHREYTVA